ncbi:MAG: hypothetical protein E7298_13725 [Lachnospiraceae bacterium]|nr:hypothetical protein [Lachnospiraceae bacterium]
MAHASCPNGHGMWNGDGKPVVWAFRVGFFRDFMKTHPDCRLAEAFVRMRNGEQVNPIAEALVKKYIGGYAK